MLISNLHSSNMIGCGRELNQSGKATEGHGWWLKRVVTEGGHRRLQRVVTQGQRT